MRPLGGAYYGIPCCGVSGAGWGARGPHRPTASSGEVSWHSLLLVNLAEPPYLHRGQG